MATPPLRATQLRGQGQEDEEDSHEPDRPLKDGERLLAPSRRPDGSLRRAIRIRAGYTPQDEVAIYQSKGSMHRRGLPQVPPGYDPVDDVLQKPKTKSAKKNQKRKEKKNQTDTASSNENGEAAVSFNPDDINEAGLQNSNREDIEEVAHQMGSMSVSTDVAEDAEGKEGSPEKVSMEKRIRALRKKIRAIESLQVKGTINAEQAEKLSRLEPLQAELSELEAQNGLLR